MPLGLTPHQVLTLVTGALVEVCALLLLALVAALLGLRSAAARRRARRQPRPAVVLGVVVDPGR